MVNKENYYRLENTKAVHFFMYMLIISVLYVQSIRKLQLVNFLMYALSKHKRNPYLIGNRKKNGSVHKAIILSKNNILALYFFTQMFNVSIDCFSKSCGTSWFTHICTIYA